MVGRARWALQGYSYLQEARAHIRDQVYSALQKQSYVVGELLLAVAGSRKAVLVRLADSRPEAALKRTLVGYTAYIRT